MQFITCLRTWFVNKLNLHERGQTAVEYVLMILVVVLFLIAAALLLRGVLSDAVASISTWIAGQGPP